MVLFHGSSPIKLVSLYIRLSKPPFSDFMSKTTATRKTPDTRFLDKVRTEEPDIYRQKDECTVRRTSTRTEVYRAEIFLWSVQPNPGGEN